MSGRGQINAIGKRLTMRSVKTRALALTATLFALLTAGGHAQDLNQEMLGQVSIGLEFVWTLLAAFLVFFMHAGFAMVEAGFTRARNAVNIIMKNIVTVAMGALGFFFAGFALMFGPGSQLFGHTGFALSGLGDLMAGHDNGPDWLYAFFIFQMVFAATGATIVSGAMAERTKFLGYIIFAFFMTLFIYPVFGHWAWGSLLFSEGGGWLEGMGFYDFAGSTVVHSIGGWTALAGATVLGARTGKYRKGKVNVIPGHNVPLAALGIFILWFGWYGFNCGSTTSGRNTAIALIAVTTTLAAAAGIVGATIVGWIQFKKPDAGMSLNGALGGLVGITAGCDAVAPIEAVIIGLIGGALVVFAVGFIDRVLKVDDPVGAISVHGVCGVWGTLAVGIFGGANLGVQALGCLVAFGWAFGIGTVFFSILKALNLLRVTPDEEAEGLDYGEHGVSAYADFQLTFLR